MSKHAVGGKPDPNFKPEKNVKMVWDEKKQVYRKVKDGEKLLSS